MNLGFLQDIVLWTLPFLVLITVVVTIHELGHYLVARAFGTAIERFSIGFGKPLASWTARNGTEWRISAIPLGGYVKFAGDANAASVPDAEDLAALRKEVVAREGVGALKTYFHFKPIWQRAAVVAAGPFANFALAIVLFATVALAFGEVQVLPRVGQVVAGSPAARSGVLTGDVIRSIDGHQIKTFQDIERLVVLRAGDTLDVKVERGGRLLDLQLTPERHAEKDPNSGATNYVTRIGVGSTNQASDITIRRFGPVEAIGHGVTQTLDTVKLTLTYIGRIFTGHEKGDQLSGAVGIAGATKGAASAALQHAPSAGAAAKALVYNMLSITALISVAVGFVNLLPIPVLDGGHLVFYGYEAVARRPLSARFQEAGYRVGFALLICLVLFSTFNDLNRFGIFRFVGGLFS